MANTAFEQWVEKETDMACISCIIKGKYNPLLIVLFYGRSPQAPQETYKIPLPVNFYFI